MLPRIYPFAWWHKNIQKS